MVLSQSAKYWDKIWTKNPGHLPSMYGYSLIRLGYDEKRAGKILEIGCGDLTYSNLTNESHCFYGLDISISALKFAKKYQKNLKLAVASASKLPFKDNSFDEVVCIETLSLLGFESYHAIEEMKRVSKNKLIFTLVHQDEFVHSKNSKIVDEFYTILTNEEINFAIFSEENVEKILSKFNLKKETLECLTSSDISDICGDYVGAYLDRNSPKSRIFVKASK